MSQLSYFSHPEDPSLISVQSRQSSKSTNCEAKQKNYKIEKMSNKIIKLQESLSIKDHTISELHEKNLSLNQALSTLTIECSQISSQKVADLSKNNRHLNSQLISLKSKYRELEKKNQKLEELLDEKDKILRKIEHIKDCSNTTETQIASENLEKIKKRLFETINCNTQLKNDLKMAHKCLQHEIGNDSINLSYILNSTSNWRGRAQQIQILQSKVVELKEKLENNADFYSFDTNTTNFSIKSIESARKIEINSLIKELDDCKCQLEELKQKLSALKLRNKNLSDEANNFKIKTLKLMDKSKNDDDYIKCLNEKISIQKFEYEHKISEMKSEILKIRQSGEDSKLETQKFKCELENAFKLLRDKDCEILHLTTLKADLENNFRNISGNFVPFVNPKMNNYAELIKGLEQEKLHLLQMTEELNTRLNKQSILENSQHDVISKQRMKISRLVTRIKELENEKESMKLKHRRSIRINKLSKQNILLNVNDDQQSNEKAAFEIDRKKFNEIISRLENAKERIAYLENKLQLQNHQRRGEDCLKLINIISKSNENGKEIFKDCNLLTTNLSDLPAEKLYESKINS